MGLTYPKTQTLNETNYKNDIVGYTTLNCLIDVTLACEDTNSKLVEVVTVVDVDDEKHVDNSLLQI